MHKKQSGLARRIAAKPLGKDNMVCLDLLPAALLEQAA